MRYLALMAAILIAGSPLRALTPTETSASDIFDAIVEKSATRSTRFSFEQSTQMMGMTIKGGGKGVYDLPKSRTDLTFETPLGQIAIRTISDGKTLWQVEETPIGKKAVRHNIGEMADSESGPVDPFMAFAGVNTRAFLTAIEDNFDIQVAGLDESASPSVYVMDLSPKEKSEVPSLQFRVGVEDAFPRQMSIYSPDGQPITEMKVTELNFDVSSDDSHFTYTPGSDVKVVNAADTMQRNVQPPRSNSALEGQPAPDFSLQTLDGQTVALSSLRGQHVLIDFWATWCPPCKKALPHLQALSEGTEGLVVLTVNAESPSVSRPFVQQHGFTFPTLIDIDRSVSADYRVTAIPTTFIIAPDGTIARQMVGYHTESQLRQALAASGLSM